MVDGRTGGLPIHMRRNKHAQEQTCAGTKQTCAGTNCMGKAKNPNRLNHEVDFRFELFAYCISIMTERKTKQNQGI